MPNKKINAKGFSEDLKSGMTDPNLMKKYNIPSEKVLERLIEKLIAGDLITPDEVKNRHKAKFEVKEPSDLNNDSHSHPSSFETNASKKIKDKHFEQKKNTDVFKLLFVGFVFLILGYFFGREHLKYEIKSTVQEATQKFRENISSSFFNSSEMIGSGTENHAESSYASQIKVLEKKQTEANKAKQQLLNFEILDAKFYKEKGYLETYPVIELTVVNNTKYAISRAYFKGTIANENRSIPWLVENFNYKIAGGLEPSEKANWKLLPDSYGSWGNVDAPNDAILTVEVEEIEGPNGETLISSRNFTDEDALKLKLLKEAMKN